MLKGQGLTGGPASPTPGSPRPPGEPGIPGTPRSPWEEKNNINSSAPRRRSPGARELAPLAAPAALPSGPLPAPGQLAQAAHCPAQAHRPGLSRQGPPCTFQADSPHPRLQTRVWHCDPRHVTTAPKFPGFLTVSPPCPRPRRDPTPPLQLSAHATSELIHQLSHDLPRTCLLWIGECEDGVLVSLRN